MDFKEVVRQRYATKKFDGKQIPETKIHELLEFVRFAASGLNLQPWKIKVITDQKTKEQLFAATWNQEQIITCSHLLIFCANVDFEGLVQKIDHAMKTAGTPDEVRNRVIGFATTMNEKMTKDQKLAWAQSQVFLALGNALNGAKALGFDSCPMSGFDPQAYSRILDLPLHLIPTALCPVGYAADKPMPKIRFALEDIVF